MKMKMKLTIAIFTIFLVSGCAFTVHDTPVNYVYSGNTITAGGQNLPNITIGMIRDTRSVENPRMIMNTRNGNGQTASGGWQAEKGLSFLVKDALKQGIAAAKLDLIRDRKVLLSGELVDVSSDVVMGWTSGTVNMKISVKLTVRDEVSSKILWRDTIFGAGSTNSKGLSSKETVVKAFKLSLNNMVDNFMSDEYFQQQVLN